MGLNRKVVEEKEAIDKYPGDGEFVPVTEALRYLGVLAPFWGGSKRRKFAWVGKDGKRREDTFRSYVSRHVKEGDDKITEKFPNGRTKSVRIRWGAVRQWQMEYITRPGNKSKGKKSHGDARLSDKQRECLKELKIYLNLARSVVTSIERGELSVKNPNGEIFTKDVKEKRRAFARRFGVKSYNQLIRDVADGKIHVYHNEQEYVNDCDCSVDTVPPQEESTPLS